MKDFETLSQAMNALREEGYSDDFNLKKQYLECRGAKQKISPKDFTVDKFYRFEGMSNPDDSSILYAISSKKYGLKGQLVNGYGIYSEDTTDEIIDKLKTR